MLKTLRDAWKVKDIREKMMFTVLMIVVYRLGSAIPVPFIDTETLSKLSESLGTGTIMDLLNMMSGGNLSQLSIFALSVSPYITSSIVVQLLTVAIPRLEELSKEGEDGRKKLQQLTKLIAVGLGILQAIAILQGLLGQSLMAGGRLQGIAILTTLLAGSMFLVWLGELITDKGVGNGISIVIFAGIVSGLIDRIIAWISGLSKGQVHPLIFVVMLLIVIFTVALVVAITDGERRVPVQYAKRVVGRKMYGGQSTHIPIKVNMGGVMPVIFAQSIMAVPSTIAMLTGGGFQEWVNKYWLPSTPVGTWLYNILTVLFIILFAFFYTMIQFNSVDYAKNLQQSGGFIPGIRPGKPTSDYLERIANRITIIGAIVLAFLTVLPTILSSLFSMNINFGGNAVMIVVGVVLETVRELEAMLQMRHYKGFLNK